MDRRDIMLIIEANLDLIASIIDTMEKGVEAKQAIRMHAEVLVTAADSITHDVLVEDAVENHLDRVLAEVLKG